MWLQQNLVCVCKQLRLFSDLKELAFPSAKPLLSLRLLIVPNSTSNISTYSSINSNLDHNEAV